MQNKNSFSLDEPKLPEQLANARRNHGGMTVPQDFFSQFESKMNAVIDAADAVEKAPEAPVVKMPARPAVSRRWAAAAAVAAVVLVLGVTYHLNSFEVPVDEAQTNSLLAGVAAEDDENLGLPEQVADEVMADASDYDVFDLYCDL